MQSLWMLVTCAMFALMGASVKFSADFDANLAQIIFFRGLPSVLILFAWTRLKRLSLVPLSWGLHIRRNLFGISAMWLSFFAMSMLQLPTAGSLTYTAPLFICIWWFFCVGSRCLLRRLFGHLDSFFWCLSERLATCIGCVGWFYRGVGDPTPQLWG